MLLCLHCDTTKDASFAIVAAASVDAVCCTVHRSGLCTCNNVDLTFEPAASQWDACCPATKPKKSVSPQFTDYRYHAEEFICGSWLCSLINTRLDADLCGRSGVLSTRLLLQTSSPLLAILSTRSHADACSDQQRSAKAPRLDRSNPLVPRTVQTCRANRWLICQGARQQLFLLRVPHLVLVSVDG